MKTLYVSGSPRNDGNTEYLMEITRQVTGGELLRLDDYDIRPCASCWECRERGECVIDDDMSAIIVPQLLDCDAVVLGSPVYFNNVTAQMKAFIDRTWAIKQKLRNKIGGAIVVGRRYGAESAITAINAFFLKHELIPANRGVSGIAFERGEAEGDEEAIAAARKLGERIMELGAVVG